MAITNNTATTGTAPSTILQKKPAVPPAPAGTGGFDPARAYPGGYGGSRTAQPNSGPVTTSPPSSQSPFTATNNLIGTQVSPVASPQTQQASALTQHAAMTYGNNAPQPFRPISQIDTSGVASQFQNAAGLATQQSAFGYQPVAPTDQSGTRAILGQAQQYATGSPEARAAAGAGDVGSFGYSGDTAGVRGQSIAQLNQLLNTTPDRASLANDTYQLLLDRAKPQEQLEDRRLAQQTAALGRVGSGMFNSSQQDLATVREQTRDQARRELATTAAQQALADQQAKLSAAQGLAGDLSSWDLGAGGLNQQYNALALNERNNAFGRLAGLDQNAFRNLSDLAGFEYGMGRDQRSDLLGERDAQRTASLDRNDVLRSQADATRQLGLDQYGLQSDAYARDVGERDAAQAWDRNAFDRQRAQFNDLSGYQTGREANDLSNRNELRGERDYQYGLSRDATADRINQWLMEQQANNTDFNQAIQLAEFGYGTNPATAYLNAGTQQGQQASDAINGAGGLLAAYGQRRGRRPAGPAAPGPAPTGTPLNDPGVYG